jgi:hypothetical protein
MLIVNGLACRFLFFLKRKAALTAQVNAALNIPSRGTA